MRITAAVFGGYAFAVTASLLAAELISGTRAERAMTAMLLSFAIYTGTILWAFAARSAWRAWIGILAPAAFCGLLFLIVK